MSKIINCDFSPSSKDVISIMIKQLGIKRAEKELLKLGAEPSVAKAVIRNVMRKKGW